MTEAPFQPLSLVMRRKLRNEQVKVLSFSLTSEVEKEDYSAFDCFIGSEDNTPLKADSLKAEKSLEEEPQIVSASDDNYLQVLQGMMCHEEYDNLPISSNASLEGSTSGYSSEIITHDSDVLISSSASSFEGHIAGIHSLEVDEQHLPMVSHDGLEYALMYTDEGNNSGGCSPEIVLLSDPHVIINSDTKLEVLAKVQLLLYNNWLRELELRDQLIFIY